MEPSQSSLPDLEGLYRRYGAALLLFAMGICNERGRAEDAVHQVFVRIAQKERLAKVTDVRAYLFASVRNAIINDSETRRRTVPIDSERAWFEPPHRDYAAELTLRHALQSLPQDQREVIVMHVWGELTFAEIAEVLGLSSNTVASRYRYAIAKLRTLLSVKEGSNASS